ncbi:MAG: amidohydrolase family protein, partial [Bacteroidia bacterium]
MTSYISANVIYPVTSKPIQNGVIGINEDGVIQAILTQEQASHLNEITYYDGVLIPGLINTHCHLELSHLRGKILEKTGLTNFIESILGLRQQSEAEIR